MFFRKNDEKNVGQKTIMECMEVQEGTLENNKYRKLFKFTNNELRASKVDSLP